MTNAALETARKDLLLDLAQLIQERQAASVTTPNVRGARLSVLSLHATDESEMNDANPTPLCTISDAEGVLFLQTPLGLAKQLVSVAVFDDAQRVCGPSQGYAIRTFYGLEKFESGGPIVFFVHRLREPSKPVASFQDSLLKLATLTSELLAKENERLRKENQALRMKNHKLLEEVEAEVAALRKRVEAL